MSDEKLFSMKKEINELTNQLSFSRKVGFFLGAGVSAAMGLPDIKKLTEEVLVKVIDKEIVLKLREELKKGAGEKFVSVEDILNELRLIRILTRESTEKNYDGLTGAKAKAIDKDICAHIYMNINKKQKEADLTLVRKFALWFNWLSRDYAKEIFTTNYDLVLEAAFENLGVPYFDGFVGANEAFFYPESVDDNNGTDKVPLPWIRLWKLHGSFNWFWRERENGQGLRIIRISDLGGAEKYTGGELVIYPSREKYESSRKMPFITFFDRLGNYLQEGEGLFLLCGYSFSDEHINQIIFDSLKRNNRLQMIAFLFNDDPISLLKDRIAENMNFTAYGPTKTIVGGVLGKWDLSADAGDPAIEKIKVITQIGNFNLLTKFLVENSTRKNQIEETSK